LALGGCWDASANRQELHQGECVTCHLANYEATSMPPHAGAFPQTCADCHMTTAWIPASAGSHPEGNFPITTGKHAGTACNDCHDTSLGPNNALNTDCVGCHSGEHRRTIIDGTHVGRSGYPTGEAPANFCLDCHPSGEALGGMHPESRFPITSGAHAGFVCTDCHDASRGPNGAGNTDCVGCHTGDHARSTIDGTHSGRSGYPTGAAAPNFCLDCHPSGQALGATHPERAFPISGGPHGPFDCQDCHDPTRGANRGGMNTDCIGCHTGEHRRSRLDSKHADVSGYPRGAAPPNFCLDCHANGRR